MLYIKFYNILINIFILLVILSIIVLCNYFVCSKTYVNQLSLFKNIRFQILSLFVKCPDQWIYDFMPIFEKQQDSYIAREYFIVNGERKELDDYDLEWVKEKCNI